MTSKIDLSTFADDYDRMRKERDEALDRAKRADVALQELGARVVDATNLINEACAERDQAREEAQIMETTLEDYHTALAKVLGFVHDFAMEHMDVGDEKALGLVKGDIERLHPILVLHDDVATFGFTLECDVPDDEEGEEITDEEVFAQTCTVCRGLLDEGDEPGSGICSTCLSADAEERADDEGGAP